MKRKSIIIMSLKGWYEKYRVDKKTCENVNEIYQGVRNCITA